MTEFIGTAIGIIIIVVLFAAMRADQKAIMHYRKEQRQNHDAT
jgi:hypothetical protein